MADIVQSGAGFAVKFHDNGDGTYSSTTYVTGGAGGVSSSTSNQSSVASSTGAVDLLADNTGRKGATIFNDSTAILYILLGTATPTSSIYSLQVASNGYYELPFGYLGRVRGLWASQNGNARITELS